MWAALHCRWYLIRFFHCPRCLQHLALAPSVSYTPISPDKLNQAYLVQSFLNLIWKNSWCLRLCWMNYDTKKKKIDTNRPGEEESLGACVACYGFDELSWERHKSMIDHDQPKVVPFSCPFFSSYMKRDQTSILNAKNCLLIAVSQLIMIAIRYSQTISGLGWVHNYSNFSILINHKPYPHSNSTLASYIENCVDELYMYMINPYPLFINKSTCFI